MHYRFPVIEHIDQVRLAIDGYDEFILAHRDGFIVANYTNITSDTFRPPAVLETGEWFYPQAELIRRECRGLIFDTKTGLLIRRPFHKFFNLNERMETMDTVVDLTRANHLLVKLDGSMIAPFVTSDNRFRIGTKMGETEVADQVKHWLDVNSNWEHMCRHAIEDGVTPIFEWMSPWNTVVIRHSEPKLTLIGLREMRTGRYLPLEGNKYGFTEIVPEYANNFANQQEIIQQVRDLVDQEGIVAVFPGGGRVKVKGDWYVAIHKVKDNLLYERNVAALILNEQIDDVLPYLDQIDRDRIAIYQHNLREHLYTKAENIFETVYRALYIDKLSKKEFALGPVKTLGGFAGLGFIFYEKALPEENDSLWREKTEAAVKELMLKQTIANSKWQEFKKRANLNDLEW